MIIQISPVTINAGGVYTVAGTFGRVYDKNVAE